MVEILLKILDHGNLHYHTILEYLLRKSLEEIIVLSAPTKKTEQYKMLQISAQYRLNQPV